MGVFTKFAYLAGAPQSETSTNRSTSNDKPSTDIANWAAAIKQALMPVTPQSSTPPIVNEMVQLKVPAQGETGHLVSSQFFSLTFKNPSGLTNLFLGCPNSKRV
jgi:hypothetical protein